MAVSVNVSTRNGTIKINAGTSASGNVIAKNAANIRLSKTASLQTIGTGWVAIANALDPCLANTIYNQGGQDVYTFTG